MERVSRNFEIEICWKESELLYDKMIVSNTEPRTLVIQFYTYCPLYTPPHWRTSRHYCTWVKSCTSTDRIRLREEQKKGMRCRVKSSRVTGWSGIECNCNGRRTRRTVAHSELFGARRGAAVVGTVRAAHVANRALSITFQVLSDGWVTGVDSGERFLMAATKTALFTGPRRIPGNCRTPPRISSSSLYLYSIVASGYGTEIVRTNRRFLVK